MENLKPLEDEGKPEEVPQTDEQQVEEKPMPFGMLGIFLLCNITQYAVFLGLTVGILAIIRVFGPK